MARQNAQTSQPEQTSSFFSNENESLFQTLFKESTDALQIVDVEGRVLYSSDSVERVIGYAPQEIQGVVVAPYIHPDDIGPFMKVWKKLLKKPRSVVTLEYRIKHKNGTWVNVETTLTNHLETEPIHAIVGNFRDVTENKRVEELLEAQIKLLSTITQNATLGLIMMDETQRCSFMNPAAEKIVGYTFEQIQQFDKPLHEIIHHTKPDGTPYLLKDCPIDRAFPTKLQTRGEDVFVHPDGTFYPVVYVASPITADSATIGTIIQLEDISEQKAAEAEHARLSQVESQRNELLRVNRSKDEFIALASHQLRTPATAVKQYTGILLEGLYGSLSDEQMSMLQKVYEANEREINIIDDLLKIARLDAGKIVLEKRKINGESLLRAAMAELSSNADKKHIPVHLKVDSPGHMLFADGQLMQTVVDNLLDNAIKYSFENQPVELILSRKNEMDYITVADNGVGIKKADRHKLFERFVRLPNPLSITSGGTGLGLYWAMKVIKMHGGDISIRTNKPSGTKFIVKIPASKRK